MDFLKAYKLPLFIILFLLYSVLMVFGGWKLNTYYTGYQSSIEQRIEKKVDDGLRNIEQQGAQNLKQTQDLIQNKQKDVITKEIPLIIDRPIYLNGCLDQDGVDALQRLKDIRKGAIK